MDVKFVENEPKNTNKIGSVIPVMSGKGGVGKSLVTGLLAVALRRQGLFRRYIGRGYHRSEYSQNVWNHGTSRRER